VNTATLTSAINHSKLVNGLHLAVTEYPGPEGARWLTLLHGIGGAGDSWLPVVDELSRHFRLLVPDLRGHGASDKPTSGYLVPDYARDLEGLLQAFEIDRPLLLGHSLGGLISLTWATDHPRKAAGIAIEDSPLRGGPRVLPRFDEWIAMNQMEPAELAAHYASEHRDWSKEDCRRRAEGMTSVALPVFTEMRSANVNPDQEDRINPLKVIESPLLLVYGDLETGGMVVPNDAVRLETELPHASTVRIPGASHSIHRDRPRELLDIVVPFLLGVDG
jgi:pimeloyl-ACP methyl ester carboxylesterase